jgi:hypothetical protein
LVGFVNGLPLVVIELKKPGVSALAALARLNPALPPEALTTAVDELSRGLLPPREIAPWSGWLPVREPDGRMCA